jgi:hypothetical protein
MSAQAIIESNVCSHQCQGPHTRLVTIIDVPGRRPIAAVVAILAAALAVLLIIRGTSGSSSDEPAIPGGANPELVQVIVDWARAESSGDSAAAASYFALPSFAQNGLTFHIQTFEQARKFNASLPCGAVVEEASEEGRYIVVTFRLGDKANSNDCGAGAGHTARTAFLIEHGKIVEWRRVPDARPAPPAPSSST